MFVTALDGAWNLFKTFVSGLFSIDVNLGGRFGTLSLGTIWLWMMTLPLTLVILRMIVRVGKKGSSSIRRGKAKE